MECSNAVVRVVRVINRGVDSNLDPSEQSIFQPITEVDILREGVVSTASLLNTPHILGIRSDFLCVGIVWVCILDSRVECLVPGELLNVRDAASTNLQGLIGEESCVQVGKEVGVGGATLVVAWDDGFERCYAVAICSLDATQVC